jgi:preprotein translocase subunit YajC
MFITPAFAQAAAPAPGTGDLFTMLVPMALIMVVFYFLLIRPQQKRLKQHQEMIGNVRRGDTIVTSGGLVGKVSRVTDDNEVLVDIAENVQVRVVKSAISDVRVKGEPVKAEAAAAKPAKK